MCSPNRIQHTLAGLQPQVICIVQAKPATRILELFWCQTLEGCLRGYRHENGQVDRAMREVESRSTSLGCLVKRRGDLSIERSAVGLLRTAGISYRTTGLEIKSQGRGFRGGGHVDDWLRCIWADTRE